MTSSVTGGRAASSAHPWRALNRVFRRRRVGLGSLITPPLAWMLVIYIGSLALLVAAAFYSLDPNSNAPTTPLTGSNLTETFTAGSVLGLLAKTIAVSLAVTVICALIALPTAYFIAKVAPRWVRRGLMVAMLLPLWAGYLVKVFAWRAMVSPSSGNRFAAEGRGGGGFMQSVLGWTPGFSTTAVIIALVYMWLPYMVLPIYAGLDRLPVSLLDASSDLGARSLRTFRSVVLPMLLPAVAAGSIFTFSLSMGDYILPAKMVDGKYDVLIGQLINRTLGNPNQPLAAAQTLLPLIVIVAYLLAMKRAGAFENL
jgi:putative spermidine/putrescine transport system permease protein